MNYDDIIEHIGGLGPYQKRILFFLYLPCWIAGLQIYLEILNATFVPSRCKIPGYHGDTYDIQGDMHLMMINHSIPKKEDTYDLCHVYADIDATNVSTNLLQNETWTYTSTSGNNSNSREVVRCSDWVYDTSQFTSTMTTEFDIGCEDKILRALSHSVSFTGSIIGSVFVGIFADAFGRKKGIMLNVVIQVVSSFATYLAPNFYFVIAMRFFSGVSKHGLFALGIATAVEFVDPDRRTTAGMVPEYFFVVGGLLANLVAYISSAWRPNQLILSIISVPFLLLWWLIPESPRWLLQHKKYKEAEEVFEKICVSNNTELPENAMADVKTEESDLPEVKVWKLLTNRTMLCWTLILFLNWFAVDVMYFGQYLYLEHLAGSIYVNNLLALLVEFLSYIACQLLLNRTGRRRLYFILMMVAGLTSLAVQLPMSLDTDQDWVVTALVMVSRFCGSASYAIIYIWSAEIFPTVLRNSGLGLCFAAEGIGGILSPYVADLGILVGGPLSRGLPLLVIGALGLVAGGLSFFLPETLDKSLPETIEEAVGLGKVIRRSVRKKSMQQEGRPLTRLPKC